MNPVNLKDHPIAHEWLKRSWEATCGPKSGWTLEQKDKFHAELGLLVDFVTDCWPKGTHQTHDND